MESRINFKVILALGFIFAGFASSIYAQYAGPFGYGIELNGTGAGALNAGITTLYALDNGGTTRLLPPGSAATLDQTSWTTNSTPAAPVLNLGTFNPGAGDTLTLLGGSMLTYQGAGATVTVSYLNYAIDPTGGPYNNFVPGVQLYLTTSNVGATTGDTLWSDESAGVNLLTGLAPGTYVLNTYGWAGSSVGDLYENNAGNNFGATFTVVQVPTTPTNIIYSVNGGALRLSWPTNYLGWLLQSQTNAANVGIQTNAGAWHNVPGSASITSTNIPISKGNPSAFYRLYLP